MSIHRSPSVRRLGACLAVVVLLACGSTDRPTTAEWSDTWVVARGLLPDEPTFRAGGEDLCGGLLGDLRSSREELFPTPSEAVDDLVDQWAILAEGVSLDCPHDEEDLGSRLAAIGDLTEEIDELTGNGP